MNIQIFGTKKCFDTKKAERYFKERKIKFQFIDLNEKALSKRELESVRISVGGVKELINEKSKLYESSNIKRIMNNSVKEEILLKNPLLLKTPIVRNGKQATVGYKPEVWQEWE
ncbi:arsenate reductase family protein [Alloiococcus sp. CFN-8]|uniref:arsenate reductase family protein n=1 Tax=Alloiococcus sp. CFN-8 TaxID=3416081 RepID=UPI003CEBBD82